MSSRYPPSRERSPPRHFDRRPSGTYLPGASSYRGTGDPQASSLDRPPPRGPKADFRGASYQFSPAPRGRGGFPSRAGDTWDRERERDRDARTQPPAYRRDDERPEWPRRERDFPPSERNVGFSRDRNYLGRDRSASPDRPRRNSKENIPSTFNRTTDSASSYYSSTARGGSIRGGRGRGDWDRNRGRSSFVSERDREFNPRSRSREDWRDRDYDRGRPAGPEPERNDRFDRREYDRPDDRDFRGRDHDIWQRDRSPGRNSAGRPASPSALSTVSQHAERYRADYDASRKSSLAGPLTARSEGRRENDLDYFSSRTETPRRDGTLSQPFTTPSVPQSASLGLDYGPPPSAPATAPAVQEKPAPTKTQIAKAETPAGPAALQPPSGPKADRSAPPSNAPTTPRMANQQFEQWPKTDPVARNARPGSTHNTAPPSAESNWKPADTPADSRITGVAAGDRPLPANVPSGPRAVSGNFRTRLLSNEQATPNAPPSAPRQPKANTIENRVVPNAPTGPRSSTFPAPGPPHNTTPTGPQASSNRQWVAPDYRPVKPSIMSQIRERSSISAPTARPGGVTYQSQQSKLKITQPFGGDSTSPRLLTKPLAAIADLPSGVQTPMDEEMVDSPANIEMSLPASDEEDVEDDDGLDEDYFMASEETHLREMKLLESKKPPPSFYDASISSLLIRIQLLGMIANDIIPEAYEEIKVSIESATDMDATTGKAPLSPDRTPEDSPRPTLEHPKPRGRPLSQPIVNPIPTPPIDELPYLNDAMEECRVFEDHEMDVDQRPTNLLLCQTFVNDIIDDNKDIQQLHDFYMSSYPLWRRDVEQAEQRLREVHQPSPAPASPAPSATPSLPPGPERTGGERTRGARNTTDLDMQQAILMSQQSAKEEEERREREAASNALPNYETEAVVPSMLKLSETELHHFGDTNGLVSQKLALYKYGFVPPEDDFTDEEQAAFIAAYCQTPKKWGKIAESIPGRSYQDCIMHYYLTKDEANYKEHWRRSQPKRGRRRAANVKPRANNLMSDLALNEDGEGTPVAVTDSGRPRRAAAPTFGDGPDPDTTTAAPQAKRLKESVKDADPSQPKPRGRKGAGTGKGRKPKEKALIDPAGQILLPAAAVEVSPQKTDRGNGGKEKGVRTSLKAEFNPKLEPFAGPALASQLPVDINKIGVEDVNHGHMISAPVQVASYWSVPERQKFPYLVQYFGRDYTAIANFLKTKSPIMIKNRFQKEIANGKEQLREVANIADGNRAKGEPMGPPPTPVQPPKRRYEATPSMATIPRVAPSIDHHLPEAEPVIPSNKPIIEEFPSNSIHRVAGEVVAKPRPPRDVIPHHSPVSAIVNPKVEEVSRSDRPSLLQKPLQGPPRGYFQDESLAYSQPHSKLQAAISEVSPLQRPLPLVEQRSLDVRPQQPTPVIDSRSTDYSMGLGSHNREPTMQFQQNPALPQYQHIPDRNLHLPRVISHSRQTSLANSHVSQSSHEQAAADLASLRNVDHTRNMSYAVSAAHSPATAVSQAMNGLAVEQQPLVRPVLPPAEPPKQAPVKRSTVFSILNDDPPEPPVKRTPLENSRQATMNTPPPQSVPVQPSLVQSRHQDDMLRSHQSSYNHPSRMDPMRADFRQDYSSSPAPGLANDTWLDKFDLRQPNQVAEQRSTQQSPAPGSYSVVPSNSQPKVASSIPGRFDPARSSETTSQRRSMLGLDRHVPSPPPQSQQQQSSQIHRSSSSSSQHGRGLSTGYQPAITTGPSSYAHAAAPTPLPGMHQRNQLSIDQPRRPTIQQHLREQEQMREREQSLNIPRREAEIMHHQQQPHSQPQLSQQPPPQPPSRLSDRRDMYATSSDRSSQHHVASVHSQASQQQSISMAYSGMPNGTYTPPHTGYVSSAPAGGHSHGHHTPQQYQSQYAHPQSSGTGQHHHQSTLYKSHPGYAPQSQSLSHQRSLHPSSSMNTAHSSHYRYGSTEEKR